MSRDLELFLPVNRGLNNFFGLSPFERQRSVEYGSTYQSALAEMDGKLREMQRAMDAMSRSFADPLMLLPSMPSEDMFRSTRASDSAGIENSIVQNDDGSRKLRLNLDVKNFKPEEISVKTKDGFLAIHAKHEDKNEHGTSYREYARMFKLPNELDPQNLKSELSPDGVLSIEGHIQPAIEAPKEPKAIPITHE